MEHSVLHIIGDKKMDLTLQIILIVITIVFVFFIITVTKKKQLSYRFTMLWLFMSLCLLTIAIFPGLISTLAKIVHIEVPANALFVLLIGANIVIIFLITMGYSKHSEKITKLVQTNALLEKRIEELERNINKE